MEAVEASCTQAADGEIMKRWYRARVTDIGLLEIDSQDRAAWRRRLKDLAGERVQVTCSKPASQRSLDQNAYLHGVVLPLLAEEWGYDQDEWPALKVALLGQWGGWKALKDKRGRAIDHTPVHPSTAALTTAEFAKLVDWVVRWAAREHGITIPLPNEIPIEAYSKT